MTSILHSKSAQAGPIPQERGTFLGNLLYPLRRILGGSGSGLGTILSIFLIIGFVFAALWVGSLALGLIKMNGPMILNGVGSVISGIALQSTNFVKYVAYFTSGEFANPTPAEDTTLYGIYLPTDSLTALQYKFRQDDKIVVKATPKVRLMGTEDSNMCVQVSCSLEDSQAAATVSPKDCISPRDLARTPVTCTFPPLVSKKAGKTAEKVSMTLTYVYNSAATLRFSVISKEKFDAKVDEEVVKGNDYTQALDKIAWDAGVSKESIADSKRGPLSIGAKIVGQPAPAGDTSAIVVTLVNTGTGGEGVVKDVKELSLSLPEGIKLVKCTDVDVDYTSPAESIEKYSKYIFKNVDVQSMQAEIRKGNFRTFDCFIDTSGAPLNKEGLFFGRINVGVSYTYNTTTETFVKVASCDELVPSTCDTLATADTAPTDTATDTSSADAAATSTT
jgi:hypothetical protein